MKHVTTLFTVLVALTAPTGAASFRLTNDPSTGEPGKFAAEEIRREATARGKATRVALADGNAGDATAQSYSLRVQNENGRLTIAVRGADAAGAMYGGLDVAEAIRTGAPDSLKDSDHTPQLQQTT